MPKLLESDPRRRAESPSSFEDVRRQQLRDGMALSTRAKVDFFEEMVSLAVRFGAFDRLRQLVVTADRREDSADGE